MISPPAYQQLVVVQPNGTLALLEAGTTSAAPWLPTYFRVSREGRGDPGLTIIVIVVILVIIVTIIIIVNIIIIIKAWRGELFGGLLLSSFLFPTSPLCSMFVVRFQVLFLSCKFLSGFCLFCGDCHFRGGVGELEVIPWGLMHQPLYFGILHQLHITSHLVLSALILTHPFPTRPSPSIHSASSPLQGKSKWKSKPNAFYQMTTAVINH